jgi:hypothetical protein
MKRSYIIIFIAVIFCVSIFFLYTLDQNKEGFYLDTEHDKTIYLVWRNKTGKNGTNHGLGDKIRGAIFLHHFCKENNVNFKIDGTDDVCGDYLKHVVTKDYDICKNEDLIPLYDIGSDAPKERLQDELSKKSTIFVYCNAYPNNLNEDDIKFAQYICTPTDSIEAEVSEKIKLLPKNYGIKHFRFHDDIFLQDINSNNLLFIKYFELLKSEYKESDVLLSNSNRFKQYAKDKLGIKTIDCDGNLCKIEHIGELFSDSDKENSSVKNSFIEFFIVSNAKYIHTHTCYEWPSNFVYWPSVIYNIPFQNVYINKDSDLSMAHVQILQDTTSSIILRRRAIFSKLWD